MFPRNLGLIIHGLFPLPGNLSMKLLLKNTSVSTSIFKLAVNIFPAAI